MAVVRSPARPFVCGRTRPSPAARWSLKIITVAEAVYSDPAKRTQQDINNSLCPSERRHAQRAVLSVEIAAKNGNLYDKDQVKMVNFKLNVRLKFESNLIKTAKSFCLLFRMLLLDLICLKESVA
ncbi:MAG: hypothetical protein ABL897_05620 [Hyphomicrobium sp.]